jgi:hypothetical protein
MHDGKIDVTGEGLHEHGIGDLRCRAGWCSSGQLGWPRACSCGGLLHADFDGEAPAGHCRLFVRCDRCLQRDTTEGP